MEYEGKTFKTTIIMTWEDTAGNDDGEMILTNNNTTRQGRLAMQEALSAEVLRWGKTALRMHGIEPLPMNAEDPKEDKRPEQRTPGR